MRRPRFLPDNFTIALIVCVVAASLIPCRGYLAITLNWITSLAIGLLFFLHGGKLSREAIIAGATNWRLHLLVMVCTFGLFPILGVGLRPLLSPLVHSELYVGVLFLCTLPSTVQSSIAFTSMAKGNVPAAVCAASASSMLGIFVTPALVGLVMIDRAASGTSAWHTVGNIVIQLLVPLVAGQLLRPAIGGWIDGHKPVTRAVDQGSILLVVYVAFSEAVNEGIWHNTSIKTLIGLVIVNAILFTLVLLITATTSKLLGFSREDQITIVFCGSKKSLASGIPMAKVIFATKAGAVVLPLMLFHQIQLMVCAVLAQRWGAEERRGALEASTTAPERVED